MKKIHRMKLKALLEQYKMLCVEAIADGDTKKKRDYKQRIEKIKGWLKEKPP